MQSGIVPFTAANQHVSYSRTSVSSAAQHGGRAANVLAGFLTPNDRAFVERAANGPLFRLNPALLASAVYTNRIPAQADEESPLRAEDLADALDALRRDGRENSPEARSLAKALHNLRAQQERGSTVDIFI